MSYYTRLDFSWDDGDRASGSLTTEEIMAVARKDFDKFGWSTDVLDDLQVAAEGRGLDDIGFSDIGLGLVDLLREISSAIPEVTFYARGVGEDFLDIWIRQLRSGEVIREIGPFDPVALST